MKTIIRLFPQEITQAIGYTILHSLWQGVLLALGLTVLLLVLNRQTAVTRYRVALGTLLLQLVFSGLTFGYYYQSAVTAGQNIANSGIKTYFLFQPAGSQTTAFLSWANIAHFFQEQLPLIVAVWLLGLAFMLLRFLGGLAYLQRLRTNKNTPLSATWSQKLQSLSTQLNLNIPVSGAESALVKTPLVIGYFKPLILLPLGTLSDLPVNQVEAILAHELAHIRRHDYVVNILQTLTEALFFYHPAIWWVSDFVRIERENCCDDHAIAICGDKFAYAQALTRLEEFKLQAPSLTLGLAGKDGSLLGRIRRLFQQPAVKPTVKESFMAAAILVSCFMALSAAALANYTTKEAITPNQVNTKDPVQNAIYLKTNLINTADLSDSTQKKKEAILIQDKDGNTISFTIDGIQVPQDQMYKYKKFKLEGVVGSTDSGGNTTMKGIIINTPGNIPAPKAPPAGKVPPAPPIPPMAEVPGNPPVPPAPPVPVEEKSTQAAAAVKNLAEASEPLYIIDGKRTDKSALNNLDPNTIQKMEVLKGASTAQYGEAGKNGVILITTKLNTTPTGKDAAAYSGLAPDHEARTTTILEELKKDNLYSNDKDYTLKITNSAMYINNVKQPNALFQKYRKYLPYPDKDVSYQTFEINGRFREK